LTISAKKIDNIINIRFEDTGIGITKSDLPKIFGEFFKADVSRHVEGEGLGLSICKEIIEDHHGRILAESEGRGKGSAILFEIPIKQKAG
jgi:signal transduction histidine kinase